MSPKQYLGDSVYASFDGFMVTLTTENGYGPSNTIHLEPETYQALVQYVVQIVEVHKSQDRLEQCEKLLQQCHDVLAEHQRLTRPIADTKIALEQIEHYLSGSTK